MIAAVVGLSTFLQARIVARAVEAEALDAAAAIALGVSADLGEHAKAPSTAELEDLLADYRKAVPAVRSITVTAADPPSIVAGTDPQAPPAILELGARAVALNEPVPFADGPVGLHLVAVPLERQHQRYGAVVVAVGMDALRRVQDQSRQAAFLFAAVAIVLLAFGLDRLTRRFVHEPLAKVLDTMAHASAGDLARARAARAPGRDRGGGRGPERPARPHGPTSTGAAQRGREGDRGAAGREPRSCARRPSASSTARRELAQQRAARAAGPMAAEVAHQVGTPLERHLRLRAAAPGRAATGSREAEKLATIQEQIAQRHDDRAGPARPGAAAGARRCARTPPAGLLEGWPSWRGPP